MMGMMGLKPKEALALLGQSPCFSYNIVHDKVLGVKGNKFPRCITLYVTERCNFNCPMCHVKDSRAKKGKDLDFELFEKLIRQAKRYTPCIQFLGGEPTMYGHITEAIALTRNNNMLTTMTTNGLLLEKYGVALVDSGLNFLSVSLDGWDEESQKKRGNVAGSFDKIINGIKSIIDYKGKRPFPILKIGTIITKNNYNHIEDIAELVKSLGITRWTIYHYSFCTTEAADINKKFYDKTGIGEFILGDNIGDTPYFMPDEVNTLEYSLSNVLANYQKYISIEYGYDNDLDLKTYYSFKQPGRSSVCTHPYTDLDVRGNGDLTICMGGYKIGNLSDDTVFDAWNGQRMVEFRGHFESLRVLPMCFRCCALKIKF